jgi:hypothetical protein
MASKVSPDDMGVSVQLGGVALHAGRTATAVSKSSFTGVLLAGGVGVPVARGMAGNSVLVGVAFKLEMA